MKARPSFRRASGRSPPRGMRIRGTAPIAPDGARGSRTVGVEPELGVIWASITARDGLACLGTRTVCRFAPMLWLVAGPTRWETPRHHLRRPSGDPKGRTLDEPRQTEPEHC